MEEFDSRVFVNCGVLVLWDTNDEETLVNRHTSQRQLLSAAPQFFRASVESEDQFAREAAQLLTALRIKVLERPPAETHRQRGDHQT